MGSTLDKQYRSSFVFCVPGCQPANRSASADQRRPKFVARRRARRIVNYGLTPEQVQELTKAAVAGAVGPLANQIADLSKRLGVTEGSALTLLRILGQKDVPLEQLPQKLAEVANQYRKLQAQLAALDPQNPEARGLIEQAQKEITAGNFSKAHDLLRQARQAQIAAAQQARALRQQAEVAENEQMVQAAASSAAKGDLALTELHYRQAAKLFKEEADLVPGGIGHEEQRLGYLGREADALYRQGSEFGDNGALQRFPTGVNRDSQGAPAERV